MHHRTAPIATLTSDSKEPLPPADVASRAVVPPSPSPSAVADFSPPELSTVRGTESIRSKVWQELQTRERRRAPEDTNNRHPERQ